MRNRTNAQRVSDRPITTRRGFSISATQHQCNSYSMTSVHIPGRRANLSRDSINIEKQRARRKTPLVNAAITSALCHPYVYFTFASRLESYNDDVSLGGLPQAETHSNGIKSDTQADCIIEHMISVCYQGERPDIETNSEFNDEERAADSQQDPYLGNS